MMIPPVLQLLIDSSTSEQLSLCGNGLQVLDKEDAVSMFFLRLSRIHKELVISGNPEGTTTMISEVVKAGLAAGGDLLVKTDLPVALKQEAEQIINELIQLATSSPNFKQMTELLSNLGGPHVR